MPDIADCFGFFFTYVVLIRVFSNPIQSNCTTVYTISKSSSPLYRFGFLNSQRLRNVPQRTHVDLRADKERKSAVGINVTPPTTESSASYREFLDNEWYNVTGGPHPCEDQSYEKPKSSKGSKKRLTEDQIRLLEINFSFNKKLDQDLKYHLSQQLNLPPRQIAIWYQNKRVRWKNQTMESDYKAMQLKLDDALSHNRELEKELEVARAMLHASYNAVSTSGDEDGGSSFLDNELYAFQPGFENHHQFHTVADYECLGRSL